MSNENKDDAAVSSDLKTEAGADAEVTAEAGLKESDNIIEKEDEKIEAGPGEAEGASGADTPESAAPSPDLPAVEKAAPEDEKTDFQPFYEKEARIEKGYNSALSFFTYILFILSSVGFLVITLDILFMGSAYKLETAACAIIWLALTVLLWKTVSFQAKAGVSALAVGLVLAWPNIKSYPMLVDPPWVLTDPVIWPIFFGLALLIILVGIWFLAPKKPIIAIPATVITLYGALAPAFAIIDNKTGLADIVQGPGFSESWPIFIRSGYVLAEIILPLGFVLFIILQGRNIFRKYDKTHTGHIFWALFLGLAMLIGMGSLQSQGHPVIVPVSAIAGLVNPNADLKPAPVIKESLKPAEEPAAATELKAQDESQTPQPEAKAQEETLPIKDDKAEAVVPAEESDPIAELKADVESLTKEIETLKMKIEKQQVVLDSLINSGDGKISEPEETPPDKDAAPAPEKKRRSGSGSGSGYSDI